LPDPLCFGVDQRFFATLPLGQCAGHHLNNEKQQNEEKYTPAETEHYGGGRLFIHLGFVLLFSFSLVA
jgi:hypothetical protein